MLKMLLFVFLMLFYLFVFSLRSLFPLTKSSLSSKPNTPTKSLTISSTPISSTEPVSASYSTFSSPSIELNISSSKRLSLESLFSNKQKSSKANIPLLSPSSSQWRSFLFFFFYIFCIIFLWSIYYSVIVLLAYVKYWYCIFAKTIFSFVNFFLSYI